MKLFVVNTCDGPVYFRGLRSKQKVVAGMAVDQVLNNDISSYDQETVEAVKKALRTDVFSALWYALKDCGAITETQTHE